MKPKPPSTPGQPRPDYWKPIIHNNKRRAQWHDYRSRCIYMVTISKRKGTPDFGRLEGDKADGAFVNLFPVGKIISEEIELTPKHNPEIRIISFVVMPDHFHLLLFVTRPMKRPLGSVIQALKSAVTKRAGNNNGPIFEEGFHDRILRRAAQFKTLRQYIADNPRRLFIKRSNPDLFRRYNHLVIGEMEFAAYGNMFLLRGFNRENVVIHRADSEETRRTNEARWLACAEDGGVLVSPFISADEKLVRDKALAAGGRLIILRNEGFEEKFKPKGAEFDLCAAGRLLLLAPWPDNAPRKAVTRREALAMNALAEKLATLPPTCPMSIRKD